MIDSDLYELLEPGVQALGYELLMVELSGQAPNSTIRVYIDRPEGITVDDCARVSDQISAVLDVEDPISEKYTLEVSSPGFDRPLCKQQHFKAALGQRVKLQIQPQVSGRKRFTGTLENVTEDTITLDVDGEVHTLLLNEIVKANVVPQYDTHSD